MGVSWWMWLGFLYVIFTITGGFIDEATQHTASATALNQVLQFKVFTMKEFDVLFFDFSAPVPNVSFFTDFASLMLWDFSFFRGDLNLVRWIVLAPITFGTTYILVTQVTPVLMNVLATARGLFRL